MRALVVIFLVLVGCGPTPPMVSVTVKQGANVSITGLARLRLLIRECERDRPTIAQSVEVVGEREPVEAGIEPGKMFYVWLQGWQECTPPCVLEESADPYRQCTCVEEDPPAQILTSEACSDWMTATEERTQVTLTLNPAANLCPPLPKKDCGT